MPPVTPADSRDGDDFEDPDTSRATAAVRRYVNAIGGERRRFAWRLWNYHTGDADGESLPAKPLDMSDLEVMQLRDELEDFAKTEGITWNSRLGEARPA